MTESEKDKEIYQLNEALKIAVETLECIFKNNNANRGDWHRCREALAAIRKLRE